MNAVPYPQVTVSCERSGEVVARCRTTDILVITVGSPVSMITPVIGAIIGPVDVSATSRVMVNQ